MNKSFFSFVMFFMIFGLIPKNFYAQNLQSQECQVSLSMQEEQKEIRKPKVAVLYLVDPIDFKKTMLDLINVTKDQEIDGVLLIIDSFGGQMSIFSAVHDLIKRVKTIKPVVSLIAGSALSCGYLIASASDYIIAPSCGDIGNIGVMQMIQRFENPKVASDVIAGLDMKVFQAGEFKTLTNPYAKKLSDKEKHYIQGELNKVYKQFLQLVAQNRGLLIKNHKVWGDGKIFLPSEAISLGLIDKIGTPFEAEEKLCELIRKKNPAQIYADNIEAIFYDNGTNQQTQQGDVAVAA